MTHGIEAYVNACISCAQRKTSHLKPAPLQKFQLLRSLFFCIAMDVVGPLLVTLLRNKDISTVQDALTKYVEEFPMPDRTSQTIAKAYIKGVILKHGTPKQLLTDLGSNFT
ncbi:hypothetical protein JTB14_031035 [Gonioctena quinquepunctata]|nr:hypothetical protein JTB14_031035 [Gonioctena quinquepunctata]